ncbi:MAG TPA: pantetheine-phosphate adenylyltransferase [Dehalococcoidia bacterium]|nr:pantetheine-phosphate adenylyltransferase [Dehalococcoidia bacterium]
MGHKAIYAGTFDPVTNGHLDIARRAAALFDHVIVAVAEHRGGTLFTVEERVEMFREAIKDQKHVEVKQFGGTLLVNFARSEGANVLIRSMRGGTDFDYEFDMALMNRKMAPEIESIYMLSRLEFLYISGSRIREVAALGYDVSDLVPAHVNEALKRKLTAKN